MIDDNRIEIVQFDNPFIHSRSLFSHHVAFKDVIKETKWKKNQMI